MKAREILLAALCLLLLLFVILFGIKARYWKGKYDIKNLDYEACVNAPVKWKEKVKTDTFNIVEVVPVPYKVIQHDTSYFIPMDSIVKWYIAEKFYADSVSFGDKRSGGMIKWDARVTTNELKEMKFKPIIFHHTDSIGIKTVDTCIHKLPEYKPKNHLFLAMEVSGINVKQMPNTSASIWWSIKDRFSLGIGAEYNFYHNEPYVKLGGAFYLK